MKIFQCNRCNQIVYFENTKCLACGCQLGFLSDLRSLAVIDIDEKSGWKARTPTGEMKRYKKCANYEIENVCNWMIPDDSPKKYCIACDLNVTVPNLDKKVNRFYWYRLEVAKRRLIFGLMELNLPIITRETDPQHGLSFQFLEDEVGGLTETKQVMTGHADGLITINLAEADDALRVKMRIKMKEEYRTVLGHFRHEIGHYYWTHLVQGSSFYEEFRKLFGDEQLGYSEALKAYYDQGPPDDWKHYYVTAYCSSHPWEDWAETWAHYLHMIDTLETAQTWGVRVKMSATNSETYQQQSQESFYMENAWPNFDSMYANWISVTCAINSINRSMGQRDLYPFVLSEWAVEKLRFVDKVVKSSGCANPS